MFAPDTQISSLRQFYRTPVPAFAAGNPGILGPFNYEFSRSAEVVGILVIPSLGTPEALAALAIGVRDQNAEPIFTDFKGLPAADQISSHTQPLMALEGRMFKAFPLLRTVRAHDRWVLELKNFSAAIVNVASVAIITRRLERK